ncbi:MAG: hypothetical protein K2M91_06940 [Lachnospiraceae bacterium]|nr:hypothetical protein [Lachnospiraceae bacterium]
MDKAYYEEMCANLEKMLQTCVLEGKKVYLFGHCNATETLIDILLEKGIMVSAILDNNQRKHGKTYRNIVIEMPRAILSETEGNTVVCIAARAYEAMAGQLRSLGYTGQIHKMVEYDSFAEYSLSVDTRKRKYERLERGLVMYKELAERFADYMKVFCPFEALGDICFCMSYLPHFLSAHGIGCCVLSVIGQACAQVVGLFGDYTVEILSQREMDEIIQAVIYTNDKNSFIAHQDRPYVVNLHKALYIKCIPLEQIYCCGVYGLPMDTKPVKPVIWSSYPDLNHIRKGKAVIFSPYAKSVTMLPEKIWDDIVSYFLAKGYQCFTNVAGDEIPLAGTEGISPQIDELKSVVEQAGTFVGIRSGLCDVIRYAECDKTALYPDYYYCDTKWKAIDMYYLDGWENIVVNEDFIWDKN